MKPSIYYKLLTLLILLTPTVSNAQTGFTENKGQWDKQIKYAAEIPSGKLFIEQNRLNFLFYDAETWNKWIQLTHGRSEAMHREDSLEVEKMKQGSLNMHTLLINFKGSNIKQEPITPSYAQTSYSNYYIGNDPSKWATHVKKYDRLKYTELYRGVDLIYKNTTEGMKYDLIVKPGTDPKTIQLEYEGADKIRLKRGYLVIETSVNTMLEEPPIAYQVINGEKVYVKCEFTLNENIVSFKVNDDYDKTLPLVIDPVLIFSTYSGTTVDNFGFTATYDSKGNAYAGGIASTPTTIPNGKYPTTAGAFSMTFNGGVGVFPCDIAISKYNPDGTQLIYATYLGGERNDYPHSLVVDKNDNLLVFGITESFFFPTSTNAYNKSLTGLTDIIVTKFNADASAIVGSTYIGGGSNDGYNNDPVLEHFYSDDHRGDIIVDNNNFVFVATSTNSNDFPVTAGTYQSDLKGSQDGVVIKFNPDLSALVWATYLGGSSGDALYSIDFDADGNVVVAGGTRSNDYKTSSEAYQRFYQGGLADGMITVLSPNGDAMVKSTYVGTNSYDQIYSIEIDDDFNVYAVGQTDGNFPVKGSVYQNAGSGQFLIKFKSGLDESVWSTVFGSGDGKPDITINAFLVDQCDKIYVSGWGGRAGQNPPYSSTSGLPITDNAYQKNTDGSDFYFIVFSKEAEELIFASYFGGNITEDHVDGGTSRFDEKGIIYQSVCSSCPFPPKTPPGPLNDFPITQNSIFATNVSPRCSNACIKYDFEARNVPPEPKDTFIEVIATKPLQLEYTVTDPNKEDTLYVNITGDIFGGGKVDPPFAQVNIGKGIGPIKSTIDWQTTCDHLTGDTIFLKVKVKDVGCPTSDSGFATVKVLVKEPPLSTPPDYFCLTFNSDGGVTLTFDSVEVNEYFDRFEVYKKPPGGSPILLYTDKTGDAFTVIDNDVSSPETRNYCYFVKGINICGREVRSSYDICTQDEAEYPVDTSYVITATVENNKEIRVSWLSSTEIDFGSYQIYRLKDGDGDPNVFKNYDLIGSTYGRYDTNFIDKNVNVQTTSYCYKLVVTDKCGHRSKETNRGCTIVLDGLSTFLQHDLDWNPYIEWKGPIKSYTLYEHVDTGSYVPIVVNPNSELTHTDRTFDYDWGGYWYKVVAEEDTANGGLGATSASNEIYLIQKPILNVPNAFTPNGDFLNDSFESVDVFVKEYNMKIFNRWGEKIFETDDKNEFWSGQYGNNDPHNTAFVWMCVYKGWDNRWHYLQGTVNILR